MHGKWTRTIEQTIYLLFAEVQFYNRVWSCCVTKQYMKSTLHWNMDGLSVVNGKVTFLVCFNRSLTLSKFTEVNCSLSTSHPSIYTQYVLDLYESHMGQGHNMCNAKVILTYSQERLEASNTWSEMKLPDNISIERRRDNPIVIVPCMVVVVVVVVFSSSLSFLDAFHMQTWCYMEKR